MTETIKGTITYDIELSDSGYQIKFDRNSENELAASIITREVLKFNKQNLKNSLGQAKGNHLKLVKDRLQKVTTTEYTIALLIESIIGEFLIHENSQKEKIEQ